VLVNNAGGDTPVPGGIAAIADEKWQAVIAANLLSAVRVDRLLMPGMRSRRRGAIIHISSSSARKPMGQLAHYAAAKAALTSYAKALALEAAPDGVRVNTVSPGMTMTPAVRGALEMMARPGRSAFADAGEFVARPESLAGLAVGLLADRRSA
jgi:NAD(P)-dependent dehydrogenase (short-subunit alcohol dehydrogenase family)